MAHGMNRKDFTEFIAQQVEQYGYLSAHSVDDGEILVLDTVDNAAFRVVITPESPRKVRKAMEIRRAIDAASDRMTERDAARRTES